MSESTAMHAHSALARLFERLREEARLPLGVDDFLQLFEALELGFGMPDREALRRLCRALWVTSLDEARLLDRLFDIVIPNEAAARAALAQLRRPDSGAPAPPAEPPGIAAEPVEPPVELPVAPPEAPGTTPVTPPAGTVAGAEQPRDRTGAPARSSIGAPATPPAQRSRVRIVLDERGRPAARFAIDDEELYPISLREMQQSWRHLRRMVREGPPTELDVDETVRRIMRQGVLLEPVMLPPRINRTRLLLLIDRDGSMAPFHQLTQRLVQTALRGGRVRHTRVFSFHNCPLTHLYTYERPPRAEPLEATLRALPLGAVALIVSDAGAARGLVNPERVEQTAAFLAQLRGRVARIAWLNPVPRGGHGEPDRWNSSSAGLIARLTPMFEVSRRGLDAAIDVLRGRSIGLAGAEIGE